MRSPVPPDRALKAVSRLAGWGQRSSSRLSGWLAHRIAERRDLWDRSWRAALVYGFGREAAAPRASGRPSRSGVIREVTEYVRRTIISEATAEPPGKRSDAVEDTAPRPHTGPSVHLSHLTLLVERRLMQIDQCRDFFRAQAPVEATHDLRVASRRLRAFLDAFESFLDPATVKQARRPLRQLTRAVGRLREWDVHAAVLERHLRDAQSEGERAALEHLLYRIDRRRAKERRRARRRLARIRLAAIAAALRKALDQLALREQAPSTTFETLAWVALERAIDRAAEQEPGAREGEDFRQLHRLRIATKRVRYTLELVRPALDEAYAPLHQQAKRVQDLLGDHHDLAMLGALLDKYEARLSRDGRLALARGLQSVASAVRAERQSLHGRYAASACGLGSSQLKREARTALLGRELG